MVVNTLCIGFHRIGLPREVDTFVFSNGFLDHCWTSVSAGIFGHLIKDKLTLLPVGDGSRCGATPHET